MKLYNLIFLIFLFNSIAVFSEDGESRQVLEKLLELPEIAQQKAACEALIKGNSAIRLDDCIWNGYSDPSGKQSIPSLDDATKNIVYDKINVGGETDTTKNSQFDQVNIDGIERDKTALDQRRDKIKDSKQQAFENALQKRLQGFLYDDKGKGIKAAYNHNTFHDLFRVQVSKNILNAASEYCMYSNMDFARDPSNQKVALPGTDPNGKATPAQLTGDFLISDNLTKRNDQRKKNIENLNVLNSKGENAMAHIWQLCLTNLPKRCQDPASSADEKYSKTKACQVSAFIKDQKIILSKLDEVDKGWNAHNCSNYKAMENDSSIKCIKNTSKGSFAINVKGKANVESQNFANIASGEFQDKEFSDYEGKLGDEMTLLEDCSTKYAANKKKCDEYIEKNKLDSDRIDELALRNRAMVGKIDKKIDGEKSLTEYFKEREFTQEKIDKILKDKTKIAAVQQEIKDKYKAEREELIKAMRKKADDLTIDAKATDVDKQQKFSDLKAEIENNNVGFKQLVHFTNVISGYLKPDSNGGNIGSNTIALQRELDNSYFDPSKSSGGGRSTASGATNRPQTDVSADYFESLRENGEKVVGDGSQVESSTNQVQVGKESIEDIFEYKAD